MITLKGSLKKITYQNSDNYYTVARIKVGKTNDLITIVGHMAGVVEGETLELKGNWVTHQKYGDQFKIESFNILLPATTAGIKAYLESGIIKGIGKDLANAIVKRFEEKTFDIIENEPIRLKEVNGIGNTKAKIIEKAWNKHHSVRRVMQFLQDRGVSVFHASKILIFYGSDALKTMKHEPYALARDIPEAGFIVADTIALNQGIAKDDPERIKACLIYLLLSFEKDGHVFVFKEALIEKCFQTIGTRSGLSDGVDHDKIEEALLALNKSKELVIDEREKTSVYLNRLYMAEKGIALRIKAMLSLPVSGNIIDDDEIIEEVASRLAIELSLNQLEVITNALKQRVVVITGGPGTGKTTLVRALCAIFKKMKRKVVLGAPTGRAARRLSEVTGQKAKTLHKLLEYDPDDNSFRKNHSNPFDLDVFIVDEASMVDTMLMYHLVAALPVTSVLMLVGDTFQLPSVGPGNVLSDIINSRVVKTFYLTEIFRQAKESPIIMNAHAIRNGEMPELLNESPNENNQALSEFYFLENNLPEKVVETISLLCSKRIKQAFPHIDEIQVLTPMHKGEAGTINLNQKLQQVLNKNTTGIESHGFIFKVGDKVMHLKNNYEKDVFNGDIGIVYEIDKTEGIVSVDYYGTIVDYEVLELDQLTLAYTISVHKSQGSEYSAVVIALTTNHFPLLQRNLLYTAITRAKHLVILVGSKKALTMALNNNKIDLRLSTLATWLKE
ncbi:MAG: ATP-dependent RecD-like DNA helicase [Desulfobacterales bacterium]|nr:ATP-dependent RecD-like DNA helicase [Desulfobacterales bacterium]